MSVAGKNVLLITLDQWRADSFSAAGHPCLITPNIDALARDGVMFGSHYSVAAPCGPARASLLTGRYLHNHRSVRNGVPLDARHATIAQAAAKLGYQPTLFGFTDTTLDPRGLAPDDPGRRTFASIAPGFLEGLHLPGDAKAWVEWLAQRGYPQPASPRDMWLPAVTGRSRVDASPPIYACDESETAYLTNHVVGFIEAQGDGSWFAHLSYFRPHHPYIAPEPYNTLYDPKDAPVPVGAANRDLEAKQHPWLAAKLKRQGETFSPVQDKLSIESFDQAAVAQLRSLYYGSLSECDAAIGRVVEALKANGAYNRTLIILTSDHGDMLGDHWLWAAEAYFEAAFRIPLIIRDPTSAADRRRGASVTAFTESVDVAPTILDWLEARIPRFGDGYSLLGFLRDSTPAIWRLSAHCELDFRSLGSPDLQQSLGIEPEESCLSFVRAARWKYVHFPALPSLLFDLATDPDELCDRASDPTCVTHLIEGLSALLTWRMTSDDGTLTGTVVGPTGVLPTDPADMAAEWMDHER